LLSFTSKEDTAFGFIAKKQKKENEVYIIFELEKGAELDSQVAYNTNIQKFSQFKMEKEILFFPFSCLEISKMPEKETFIKDNNYFKFYRIYLNYLGKYNELFG
jgi:hypothetical protein